MYYGKKRAITIAIVAVIVSIIVIVGGLFLFLATDIFKSNDALFYKNIAKQFEQLENFKMDNIAKILEAKTSTSYETNSKLEITSGDTSVTKFDIVSKNDKENDKRLLNVKTTIANQVTDITYARSNDILAIKWEEVVQKYFVGIKNENLKVFAQKLGIRDTSYIPDSIDLDFSNNMYKITKQEKEHIYETYFKVFKDSIPTEKFSKQNNMSILHNDVAVDTTAYRVDLNQSDVKNVLINVLQTLKEDSITLNILASNFSTLNLEDYSNVNDLVNQIDTLIEKINKENNDDSKGLSIILYENGGKIIQTEIIFTNELKITLDFDINKVNNKLNMTFENFSENQNYDTLKIEIKNQPLTDGSLNEIKYNLDDKGEISISISTSGSVDDIINTNILCEISDSLEISYEAETSFGDLEEKIIDLDETKNCIVLNNYNQAQLQSIISQITNQLSKVIQNKIINIQRGMNNLSSNLGGNSLESDIEDDVVQAFNAKFTNYIGNINGTNLKMLIDLVKNNNSVGDRKVVLVIDGTSYLSVEKSSIQSVDLYTVRMEYDSEGYVSKIIAVK